MLEVREANVIVKVCDEPVKLDVSVEELFSDILVLALPMVVTLANDVEELIPVSAVDETDEIPVGPVLGSEEFVVGKGVASLVAGELTVLVLLDNIVDSGPGPEVVDELSSLSEVPVEPADESDEFVSGIDVVIVVGPVAGIEELATV